MPSRPDPEFRTCNHSIGIEGRLYTCRLHVGHNHQHRARVASDRPISVGRLEQGAEIVWPNER